MRNIDLLSLSLLLAAAACGGNGGGGGNTGGNGSGTGGNGGDGAGGSAGGGGTAGAGGSTGAGGSWGDVTGTSQYRYQPSTGEVVLPNTTWTSIEARVDEGMTLKSYPGTIDAAGKINIPGVPEVPYLLALESPPPPTLIGAQPLETFVVTDARVLNLENAYSGRHDTTPMTQPSYLTINATLTQPWRVYTDDGMGNVQPLNDQMELVSRNGLVVGYAWAPGTAPEDNPPADGATQLAGWRINAQDAFISFGAGQSLVDGSKGDDFTILHDVSAQVGMPTLDGNPWNGYIYTSTQEFFQPASFTMTNGGTTALSGAFKPAPQKTFEMDFKGSAFTALFANVPFDTEYASIGINYEAGAPLPAYGAFAALLDVNTTSGTAYSNPNPACHSAGCDLAACPSGCDAGTIALIGDHAHTYSYGNPFTDGQELGYVLVQVQKRVTTLLPENTSETLRGTITIHAPVSEISGKPIQPVIGLPQNIKVGGVATPYDQVTTGVGTTPVITWDAPSLGTPTRYRVILIDTTDLTDSMIGTSRRRNVATFTVPSTVTTVSIPDGILKPGKYYYFQVMAAARDTDDLASPFAQAQREAAATMFTGIVTP